MIDHSAAKMSNINEFKPLGLLKTNKTCSSTISLLYLNPFTRNILFDEKSLLHVYFQKTK